MGETAPADGMFGLTGGRAGLSLLGTAEGMRAARGGLPSGDGARAGEERASARRWGRRARRGSRRRGYVPGAV